LYSSIVFISHHQIYIFYHRIPKYSRILYLYSSLVFCVPARTFVQRTTSGINPAIDWKKSVFYSHSTARPYLYSSIVFIFHHQIYIFYHRIRILESCLYSSIVFVFEKEIGLLLLYPVQHKLWTSCTATQVVGPLNTAWLFVQRRMSGITQHHIGRKLLTTATVQFLRNRIPV